MASSQNSICITGSPPDGDHTDLSDRAEQHDVSLPWLARRAVAECPKNHGCGSAQLVLDPSHDGGRRQE